MASTKAAQDDVLPMGAVLPVGQVSALLGIPAVTLRTWDARYGVSPSERTAGQHRRYTEADVERIRRMHRLITSGVSAQDAARLSHSRPTIVDNAATADWLISSTEELRTAEIDDLFDTCLDQRGAGRTWTEIVAPAFRQLGVRFAAAADCTDLELLLSSAFAAAIDRYLHRRQLRPDSAHPTLLVHCPEERHTLPLTVLRAVLLERSQPVVLLGPETTPTAVMDFIARANPVSVVLWASMRRSGQAQLRQRVERTGHQLFTAGPGWPRRHEPLTSLADATTALAVRRKVRTA
ncbi:MerR family transcriptional regulator [Kribbella sp. NPDC051952]|uniref:MerR family transcriptional regulator n=1 Tax=Kribbella sp. NPDC051952 TaxID=3154851 RepID=UPI00341FEF5B